VKIDFEEHEIKAKRFVFPTGNCRCHSKTQQVVKIRIKGGKTLAGN